MTLVATTRSFETISSIESELIFPNGDLYSNEPEMESFPHLMQMLLLISCLRWQWRDRQNYFVGGNMTIYFSPSQKKSEFFRGPDFFLVLDCDPNPKRKSWAVWQEGGKYPNLIVEILSDSTADVDRGEKKQIYQDIFRTPDYFLYDPYKATLEGYHLVEGRYKSIIANSEGRMWSAQLELFLGVYADQLRFFTPIGELIPTPEELVEAEIEQLELVAEEAKLATAQLELVTEQAKLATERADLEYQKRVEIIDKLKRSLSAEQLEAMGIEIEDFNHN
jgi:Uma2 family endonuclease